ncbi:MAG: hypothetical protein C5B50_17600 [Verrucomicrobia bacterium]|nr:MAG: hypothetical protein C5B50_17600 [Verrucomicrobiota bacterium]
MEEVHMRARQERLRGHVESWVPSLTYGYHGYIRCDDQTRIPGLVLVNSTSLRKPGGMLSPRERVEFTPVSVLRGVLATDVIAFDDDREAYEGVDPEDDSSYVLAVLRYVNPDRYFGILELPDGRTAFLHFSQLQNPDVPVEPGSSIRCRLEQNRRKQPPRLEAFDAAPTRIGPGRRERAFDDVPFSRSGDELLARALLARERGDFSAAGELYERAMRESPSPRAVLSYAAMRRALGQEKEAARVFESGIRRFPSNPIIHEHAGLLAASVGDFAGAIRLLEHGLTLSRRRAEQSGEKGILLSLARTFNRMADRDGTALKAAIRYYEEASEKFGNRGLPFERDKRNFELARFRHQHYRGNLVVGFLRSAGFEIVRAQMLTDRTTAGDLVVKMNNPELAESYGLPNLMLVCCKFQSEVTLQDLDAFDERIRTWGRDNGCGEGAAVLFMASLSEEIQRILNTRISDRREHCPAIIPISQEEIERKPKTTEQSHLPAAGPSIPQEEIERQAALKKLREALDKWLFQRDLFATNSPVQGDRFFGRTNALARIASAVSGSRAVGIFGLRKVGKTSLLQEFCRRCSISGDVVLYSDLLKLSSERDTNYLYWGLANELRLHSSHLSPDFKWRLGGVFEQFADVPSDFKIELAFDADLRNVLKKIGSTQISPRPKVVLMLDEVERLLPHLHEPGCRGFFEFLSYFRAVCQETKDFTMIVTAANPGIQEAAQFDRRDNPVFNFFEEAYLAAFEESECSEMVAKLGRGMGMRFEAASCSQIFKLTGGHPFITRMFCSYISDVYKAERPRPIMPEMVEALVDRYVDLKGNKDFKEIFERLERDYPEERDLCVALAQAEQPVPFESVDKSSVRHLIEYELVRLEGKAVTLSMDLLRRWLKRNYGDSEGTKRNS